MPEFGAGQHHTGKEGAQSGRQPHQHHREGNAHNNQQGKGGIHLAQFGRVDIAEHGAGEEHARNDNARDGTNGNQRDAPSGQVVNKGKGGLGGGRPVFGAMGRAGRVLQRDRAVWQKQHIGQRHGNKWQKRQHRDDCNILRQQHREHRPSTGSLHQPFFAQGLQDNRRGAQREGKPDRQRYAPRLAVGHGDPHQRQRAQHDLQAAQPQQLVAHIPQCTRFQFKSDQEQHHHNTKFGKVLEILGFRPHKPQHRPDQDPCR